MSTEHAESSKTQAWFVKKGGQQIGPMSLDVLLKYVGEGVIRNTDMVRGPTLIDWTKLDEALIKLNGGANSAPQGRAMEEGRAEELGPALVRKAEAAEVKRPEAPQSRPHEDIDAKQPLSATSSSDIKGRIKFLDPKTRNWGFISREDGQKDIFPKR